ncbi:hypothetical protein NEOLEDRAFT_1246176 [Neolentinus lepideus HHB14362 ss-1]|uniref:Uncharacterized protein n=1 Tax=Neolentinus lepideus HHB14362 ss-1 TaxID=1314782 RepID=A0A165MXR9_9AGAM|nr:hypothetical protein NEOLEDRAFT_1246176 [Neolentinus lepideus HHB14362 ss-1]
MDSRPNTSRPYQPESRPPGPVVPTASYYEGTPRIMGADEEGIAAFELACSQSEVSYMPADSDDLLSGTASSSIPMHLSSTGTLLATHPSTAYPNDHQVFDSYCSYQPQWASHGSSPAVQESRSSSLGQGPQRDESEWYTTPYSLDSLTSSRSLHSGPLNNPNTWPFAVHDSHYSISSYVNETQTAGPSTSQPVHPARWPPAVPIVISPESSSFRSYQPESSSGFPSSTSIHSSHSLHSEERPSSVPFQPRVSSLDAVSRPGECVGHSPSRSRQAVPVIQVRGGPMLSASAPQQCTFATPSSPLDSNIRQSSEPVLRAPVPQRPTCPLLQSAGCKRPHSPLAQPPDNRSLYHNFRAEPPASSSGFQCADLAHTPSTWSTDTGRNDADDNRRSRKRRMTIAISAHLGMPPAPAEVRYYGNLDLYAVTLPGLAEKCLPAGQTFPQYEDVYQALLYHQAKSLHTGRCYLPEDSETNCLGTGYLRAACVWDPVAEAAFDVVITEIHVSKTFKISSNIRDLFPGPTMRPPGPGINAKTHLSLEKGYPGVKGSHGIFKLKRVWVKIDLSTGEEQELFEGFFSLNVRYSEEHRKRGADRPQKLKFAIPFWAIRAAKDVDGKEIGLVPLLSPLRS